MSRFATFRAEPPMLAGSPGMCASTASTAALFALNGHLVVAVFVVLVSLLLLSRPVTVLVKHVAGYVPGVQIDTGTLLGG